MRRVPLDIDAGLLAGGFGAVFAAAVGSIRGLGPGSLSGFSLIALALAFGIAGLVVGSVVAGLPDFGPTRQAALVRGFVATIPVYACGGLLFLPPDRWFTLLPLLSVAAAAIVGPPIGVFMYRWHRRLDSRDSPVDSSVQLAWVKGEMVASWTPLLVSIALLAALGVGMRAVPVADPALRQRPPVPLVNRLPALRRAAAEDPTDAEARYLLGRALTSLGQFGDAVAALSAAVSLDSTRADYWVAFGRAAFFGGQTPLSTQAYWKAMRIDPTSLREGGLDRVIFDAVLTQAVRRP